MPIFDHFDLIAPFYDRIFSPGEMGILLEKIDLPNAGFLLDAGGGTGRIAQFLRTLTDHIIVADLSYEMLLQANNKSGLLTVCSHTENLPFRDGIFDRIIMIDALHHVCDQADTAKELLRVLKPGGRIIIEEPNIEKFVIKGLAVAEKILGMRSHFLSPTEIANLFEDCVTKIESGGHISWVMIDSKFI